MIKRSFYPLILLVILFSLFVFVLQAFSLPSFWHSVIIACFLLFFYLCAIYFSTWRSRKKYMHTLQLFTDQLEIAAYVKEAKAFLAKLSENSTLKVGIYLDIAMAQAALGHVDIAMQILHTQQAKQKYPFDALHIARNLCLLYLEQGDIANAKIYETELNDALKIYKKTFLLGSKQPLLHFYENNALPLIHAKFLLADGAYEMALTQYKNLLQNEKLSNLQMISIQFDLAKIYHAQGDIEKQKACYIFFCSHRNEHIKVKIAREMLLEMNTNATTGGQT